MSTHCKLIFGYTDHTNWWNETEAYYRNSDGYPEAIIPLLQEHGADVTTMNLDAEYDSHKWEKLESSYDGVTGVDYIYYIDTSNRNNIRCTVLGSDLVFYKHYGITNYEVKTVLTL